MVFAEKAVAVNAVMGSNYLTKGACARRDYKLPVTVFAMENNIKTVKVNLQSNDFMEVIGTSSQTLNFSQTGDQHTSFWCENKMYRALEK